MKQEPLARELNQIHEQLEKLQLEEDLSILLEQSEQLKNRLSCWLGQFNSSQLQLSIYDGTAERPFGLPEEEQE